MEQKDVQCLFDAYAQEVFRLAFSYLHNRQDAEDVTQTVFMKLLSTKWKPKAGKEKSWLLACTANACKDHLKSFWYKKVVCLEERMVFPNEMDQALWEAVSALPPKYRMVVHLYYYEGYTQDEIADILKISCTAVQTRMSRARRQLKEVLCDGE